MESEQAIGLKPEERVAYFVLEDVKDERGEYIALIAKEGERGYYKTDWTWGKDFKHAKEVADYKNKLLGVSKVEALKIVLSTMKLPG